MNVLLIAVPIFPLLAIPLALGLGRRLPCHGGELVIGAAALTLSALLFLYGEHQILQEEWFETGGFRLTIGLELNGLTWFGAVVVTTISLFVSVYSLGYMAGEKSQPRFYAELAFFIGAMLTLVLASSLILLFAAWEAVGLASYLLIGFNQEEDARPAAIKAFLMTRIGDVGFLLGWLLALLELRTTDITALLSATSQGGFSSESAAWRLTIAAIAIATMTLGNMAALRQNGLKRLLAYSSIAQAGYVLIAVSVADQARGAIAAVGFYLLAYLLMNLGAFLVVAQIERAVGSDTLTAFRGLGRRSPWIAAALAICLLSLAGIPPFAGFAGKVFLLSAAIDGDMAWLAIFAAVNMAIGLFYYVRIIAEMYLEAPLRYSPVKGGIGYTIGLLLCTGGTLFFGIAPNAALSLSDYAHLLS